MAALGGMESKDAHAMDGDFDEDAEAFEALEKDFYEVLESMVGDKTLESFRSEYVKLHEALKKSHENERRLVKKVKEMSSEMKRNAAQVASAMKLSEDDDATIYELRKQVEKAHAMIEGANQKEEAASAVTQKLQTEIDSLKMLVDRYTGLLGEDTTLEDVIAARDQATRQFEEASAQAEYERKRADELLQRLEQRKSKGRELKDRVAELQAQVRSKEDEEQRESKRTERLRDELEKVKTQLIQREKELEDARRQSREAEGINSKNQAEIKKTHDTIRRIIGDQKEMHEKERKLRDQKDDLQVRCGALQDEVATLQQAQKEAMRITSKTDQERKRVLAKLHGLEQEKARLQQRVNQQKEDLRKVLVDKRAMEMDVEVAARKLTEAGGAIGKLEMAKKFEEEKVKSEVAGKKRAEAAVKEQLQVSKEMDSRVQDMMMLNEKLRRTLMKLEKRNARLEQLIEQKDKEKAEVEGLEKMRQQQVQDAERRETESQGKLKQQRQMYDTVRADRNVLSKQLVQSHDEIAELRRKFKIMSRQVEQLKEDVAAKDRSLVAVHFDNKAALKRLDDKAREADGLREALAKSDAHCKQLSTVVEELNAAIRKQDEAQAEQKRKAGDLVTERDVLGAQLIRRNDELALQQQKLEIQESILKKGETQFAQVSEDVAVLKRKVADLRREMALANQATGKHAALQQEVVRLQKQLMEERTKVTALSQEMEQPLNVHRWRRLEGSDPATFELLQKVQTLQRRLIRKTEQVVECEMLLQEKDRLYVELREILQRQPGPEVAERLSAYQQTLRDKSRQVKSMASELNMLHAQVGEYRYESERLQRELQEAKHKYYAYRKKEARQGQRAAAEAAAAQAAGYYPPGPAGGGPPSLPRASAGAGVHASAGGDGMGAGAVGGGLPPAGAGAGGMRGGVAPGATSPAGGSAGRVGVGGGGVAGVDGGGGSDAGARLLEAQRGYAQAATQRFAGGGFSTRPRPPRG